MTPSTTTPTDSSPESDRPSPTAPPLTVRRRFLKWMTYGLGALAGVMLSIPFVGYFLGALRKRKVEWIALGPSAKFPVNETRLVSFRNRYGQPWDGMAAQMGVYVRSLGDEKFLVFAMNCAHLGCPVTWFPQSGLFMCPCHGGVYYENGERASGPPTRGLFRCVWRVREGELEIQTPHLPTLQDTLDHAADV